jgi:serine/threonine-protein kinase
VKASLDENELFRVLYPFFTGSRLTPGVSPALQETIYRALERDPRKRYATAREFARDLHHPELIAVAARSELREWAWPHNPLAEKILFGLKMAAIPGVIFSLLIYVARHT